MRKYKKRFGGPEREHAGTIVEQQLPEEHGAVRASRAAVKSLSSCHRLAGFWRIRYGQIFERLHRTRRFNNELPFSDLPGLGRSDKATLGHRYVNKYYCNKGACHFHEPAVIHEWLPVNTLLISFQDYLYLAILLQISTIVHTLWSLRSRLEFEELEYCSLDRWKWCFIKLKLIEKNTNKATERSAICSTSMPITIALSVRGVSSMISRRSVVRLAKIDSGGESSSLDIRTYE
ncbi:hypothetical protein KM043_005774 [Ampulex compressa]|nr:hypothetical protein KM043_005774 [Ampulex compressa]